MSERRANAKKWGSVEFPQSDAHRTRGSMFRNDVLPSGLPSLLLPCTHCGHRMIFGSVEPSRLGSGAASNDLEDITHHCVQCGTTLVRTMLSPSAAAS
jgi:hypothetical protein